MSKLDAGGDAGIACDAKTPMSARGEETQPVERHKYNQNISKLWHIALNRLKPWLLKSCQLPQSIPRLKS